MSRVGAVEKYTTASVKEHGRNSVLRADRDLSRRPKRGRTGSVAYDYCHGAGILFGQLHLFVGMEHSGKTTMVLHHIADMHRRCANCLRTASRVVYGPPAEPIDGAEYVTSELLAEGSSRTFDGKPAWTAVRNKATKEPGRIVSIRWRTKSKRQAVICVGRGIDDDGQERGAWHAPVFLDVPIDEPDKCEWELCKDHGVTFDVPFCDCAFVTAEPIPYLINQETGQPESDADFAERVGGYRMAGNSYDATLVKFFDLEDKLNLEWAASIGVDLSRLFLAGAAHGEDVVDMVNAAVNCALFAIIAIDSIEFIEPKAQVEASAHDSEDQGRGAKLANRGFREWVLGGGDIRRRLGRRPTFLVVNQLRSGRGADTWVIPKGYMQKYATTTIFKFWTSQEDRESLEVSGNKAKKGKDGESKASDGAISVVESVRINFIAEKQGAGTKVRGSCELRIKPIMFQGRVLVPKGQIFDHEYVFKVALANGIIRASDAGFALDLVPETFGTQKEIKRRLVEDRKFYELMRQAVLERLLKFQSQGDESWGDR